MPNLPKHPPPPYPLGQIPPHKPDPPKHIPHRISLLSKPLDLERFHESPYAPPLSTPIPTLTSK